MKVNLKVNNGTDKMGFCLRDRVESYVRASLWRHISMACKSTGMTVDGITDEIVECIQSCCVTNVNRPTIASGALYLPEKVFYKGYAQYSILERLIIEQTIVRIAFSVGVYANAKLLVKTAFILSVIDAYKPLEAV